MDIRNYTPPMQYRRFGKTEKQLSVITLGGMRYVNAGGNADDELPADAIDHCRRVTQMALEHGINHIETAKGYGKSEALYGRVLNAELGVPRDRYWLMTKGTAENADDMRSVVESQLRRLRTDHIDLYGYHGINTPGLVTHACSSGGPVEGLLQLRDEGVIGNVGFSTHGPLEAILAAIETDLFDFVNLHFYYFFQRNLAAVMAAHAKDMGVFIISPNDKGGQLFNPSPLLRDLTAPLTPIQFNARWCLRHHEIQTLSFGMTEPEHFEEMSGICPVDVPPGSAELETEQKLNARILADPTCAYEGYDMLPDPSGINIPEVLRFRRMWRCYDMKDFGIYRYNMLEEKGHWFPGVFATPDAVKNVDISKAPPGLDIRAMLSETHAEFYRPKKPQA